MLIYTYVYVLLYIQKLSQLTLLILGHLPTALILSTEGVEGPKIGRGGQ